MIVNAFRRLSFTFSALKIPIVDVEPFLKGQVSVDECKTVAESLHNYGCLIIKDPRVNQQ